MATYSRVKLSGSTNGRNIKVVQTATAGTLIHTAHATDQDEVWLWAINTSAAPVKLTIEYGGVSSPDDLIEQWIEPESGLVLIVPGSSPLTGAVVVGAFAGVANVINIQGYVNRITP